MLNKRTIPKLHKKNRMAMLFIFHLFIYFKCLTVFNVSSYASKMYFMGVKGYPKALPK